MKKLATRSESGFLSSLQDFASSVIMNKHILREPEHHSSYQESFGSIETICLKLSMGPVQAYDNLTYDIFGRIITATGPAYH